MKDYKWGRKWKFKSGKTVREVLCKSHYGNAHLQMGKNPITVAKDSGLCAPSPLQTPLW